FLVPQWTGTTAGEVGGLLAAAGNADPPGEENLIRMARIIDEERLRCAVAEAYQEGRLKHPVPGLVQRGAVARAIQTLQRLLPGEIEAARRTRFPWLETELET